MNGPERFAASNLAGYGHRRAAGNRGGFTTEASVVSVSAISHWVSSQEFPPFSLMLVSGQSCRTSPSCLRRSLRFSLPRQPSSIFFKAWCRLNQGNIKARSDRNRAGRLGERYRQEELQYNY
jgi:hypothetical protein